MVESVQTSFCNAESSLALDKVQNIPFASITKIEKIKHWAIPLVLYNQEELLLGVDFKHSSLERSYEDFFEEAFETYSNQFGCYNYSKNPSESDYQLSINFNTCEIKSKYKRRFKLVFLLYYFRYWNYEQANPATAKLNADVRVVDKNNNIIIDDTYEVEATYMYQIVIEELKDGEGISKFQQRRNYLRFLSYAVAKSSSSLIEQVIQDINEEIG